MKHSCFLQWYLPVASSFKVWPLPSVRVVCHFLFHKNPELVAPSLCFFIPPLCICAVLGSVFLCLICMASYTNFRIDVFHFLAWIQCPSFQQWLVALQFPGHQCKTLHSSCLIVWYHSCSSGDVLEIIQPSPLPEIRGISFRCGCPDNHRQVAQTGKMYDLQESFTPPLEWHLEAREAVLYL